MQHFLVQQNLYINNPSMQSRGSSIIPVFWLFRIPDCMGLHKVKAGWGRGRGVGGGGDAVSIHHNMQNFQQRRGPISLCSGWYICRPYDCPMLADAPGGWLSSAPLFAFYRQTESNPWFLFSRCGSTRGVCFGQRPTGLHPPPPHHLMLGLCLWITSRQKVDGGAGEEPPSCYKRGLLSGVILSTFFKILLNHAFLYRVCDPKSKILVMLALFSAFYCGFHISVSKSRKSPFWRAQFLFFKVGRWGCNKIQNFMLISDQNAYLRKSVPEKSEIKYKKHLIPGLGIFLEQQLSRSSFLVFFRKFSLRSEISISFWILWHPYRHIPRGKTYHS